MYHGPLWTPWHAPFSTLVVLPFVAAGLSPQLTPRTFSELATHTFRCELGVGFVRRPQPLSFPKRVSNTRQVLELNRTRLRFSTKTPIDSATILQFSNKPLTFEAFVPHHFHAAYWRSYQGFCHHLSTRFRSQSSRSVSHYNRRPTVGSHDNLLTDRFVMATSPWLPTRLRGRSRRFSELCLAQAQHHFTGMAAVFPIRESNHRKFCTLAA